MKLPDFDHKHKLYDRFRHAFYNELSAGFMLFETGELLGLRSLDKSEMRRVYRNLGLEIVGTNDDDCPRLLTPEGVCVPKAHLDYKGQHIICVDLDTGYVAKVSDNIPENHLPWQRLLDTYIPLEG